MKKIFSVLLIILMFSLILCSCGKSEEAKAVEAKIEAIGEIDLSKGTLIEEAEKAYAILRGEDKSDVKNYDDLKNMRESYNKLKEYSDKAEALAARYDRIFSEYGISYSEVVDPFNELTTNYPSSDDPIRAEYDKILAPVQEKNEEYEGICKGAVASAVTYINGFKKAVGLNEMEIKDFGGIAQVSEGTVYYLFAMTYNDGSGTDKSVYSSARFAGTPSLESMMEYKDNFYSETPLSEKTDALKCGNLLFDINDILEALN